jgi:integrase
LPTIKLTQSAVDKLKIPAEGRIIVWDRLLPGFGLRLGAPSKRSKQGTRTWVAMFRCRGRSIMQTLASQAQVQNVRQAREMARDSMLKARAGINPVEARRRLQEAERDTIRFRDLVEIYLDRHARSRQKPTTLAETRRQLAKDVTSVWGSWDVTTITEADVRRLRDKVHARAPVQSNRIMQHLKALFSWAEAERYIAVDPSAKVRPITEVKPRDRWLDDVEIVRFWHGCEQLGWPYGPLAQMLLVTGQRRDEVAEMERTEIDLARRTWTIPARRAKNGTEHEVALSALAVEILINVPRIGDRWVFTMTGEKPVSGWSTAKAKLDRLVGEMPEWRLHDLRRSCATGMAKLGIRAEVCDRILNHAGGSVVKGVAAVYNRFEYLNERRTALEAWSAHIERLLAPSPKNIVQIAQVRM